MGLEEAELALTMLRAVQVTTMVEMEELGTHIRQVEEERKAVLEVLVLLERVAHMEQVMEVVAVAEPTLAVMAVMVELLEVEEEVRGEIHPIPIQGGLAVEEK